MVEGLIIVGYLVVGATFFHFTMKEIKRTFDEGGPMMEMNYSLNENKLILTTCVLALFWPVTVTAAIVLNYKNKDGGCDHH